MAPAGESPRRPFERRRQKRPPQPTHRDMRKTTDSGQERSCSNRTTREAPVSEILYSVLQGREPPRREEDGTDKTEPSNTDAARRVAPAKHSAVRYAHVKEKKYNPGKAQGTRVARARHFILMGVNRNLSAASALLEQRSSRPVVCLKRGSSRTAGTGVLFSLNADWLAESENWLHL